MVVLLVQTDMAVQTERLCNLVAEVGAQALARDPANHLADQPSVSQRVVAVTGARLPPWFLFGERGGHRLPIK